MLQMSGDNVLVAQGLTCLLGFLCDALETSGYLKFDFSSFNQIEL